MLQKNRLRLEVFFPNASLYRGLHPIVEQTKQTSPLSADDTATAVTTAETINIRKAYTMNLN